MRPDRYAQCPVQHKKCYPTNSHAIDAACRCSMRRGTALRLYYHEACGHWHLTKKPLRMAGRAA